MFNAYTIGMKNRFKPLMILAVSLLLAACSGEPENTSNTGTSSTSNPPTTSTLPPQEDDFVVVKVEGINSTAKAGGYDAKIYYRDDDFDQDATTYSDKIKMLSFGSAIVSKDEETAETFFETMGYDNFSATLPEPTTGTIGFTLAHKGFANYDLVALSIRGSDYGQEWSNNLLVGKEGNHNGFQARADEIKDELQTYLGGYTAKPVKLWISGYSRGGGVANLLASDLLKNGFNQSNLYVYTFEAPRGLTLENAPEYPNVFNLINSADPVARIAPEEYGLYRCGKDIIIDEGKDVEEALAELDPELTLPAFTPSAGTFENDKQFTDFILSTLLGDTGDPNTNLNTRASFVDNYQADIGYFIGLYFSLDQSTVDKLGTALKNAGATLFDSEDNIYNTIKPILVEDGVTYDDAKLHSSCSKIYKLLTTKSTLILTIAFMQDNLKRAIYMHSLDTVYALIK